MPKLILSSSMKVIAVIALLSIIILSQQSFADEISAHIYIPKGGANMHCAFLNNCFKPAKLTVKVGDTVEWHNQDAVIHTITSGNGFHDNYGKLFDSKLVLPEQSFSYKFTEAGTYDYFCEIHPWKTGKIIVVQEVSEGNGQ